MYNEYIKEREGYDVIETEKGFAIYKILGDECYIKDIYVLPEFRKERVASMIANMISEIARDQKCKVLSGSVSLTCGDPTTSIKVLLGYGMSVTDFKYNLLWFVKQL